MATILLCVTGLRDEADEERVRLALEAEPGVYGAVVDRAEDCAEVDCEEDEIALDRLLEVVREAGFEAALGG